jgi:hypothetical protein
VPIDYPDVVADAILSVLDSYREMDLIRFGGRVNDVDLVSSSFVEESLQALGGIRISIRRSRVAAGERPVAI